MSALKPKEAQQEDKDVTKSASDSPGRTQEPLPSHTSSPKNNATGLSSSEEHENPLNGARPNPFVYSGVPAVPHAGDSLPSGTLVNGPASHPASEARRVLNKGTIFSNNVLEAEEEEEEEDTTSPQVSPPPGELQSDAWRNTAGLGVLKALPTQPAGANNAAPSHSVEENESKLPPNSTLQSGDGGGSDQTLCVSLRPLINNKAVKTRALLRGHVDTTELSEGCCSDDYDDETTEATRWDSATELHVPYFSKKGHAVNRRPQRKARVTPLLTTRQTERKYNTYVRRRRRGVSGTAAEKVYNSLVNHTHNGSRHSGIHHVDKFDTSANNNKYVSLGKKPNLKHPIESLKDHHQHPSSTTTDSSKLLIGNNNNARKGCHDAQNYSEEACGFNAEPEQPKTERSESEDALFALCNVNFQEKIHLHRHMMYHLDDRVENAITPYPFICRECGRSFCDSGSLMKHIVIHQERLEKLMEEIKGLKNLENHQGRNHRATVLQWPQCVFASNNCPKTFNVQQQHARAGENVKHYYCCEECSYVALTEDALETHLNVVHLKTHHHQQQQQQHWVHTNDTTGLMDLVPFQCKQCSFTSQDRQTLKRHSELEHEEPLRYDDEWGGGPAVFHKSYEHTESKVSRLKFNDRRPETADSERMHLMPDLCNAQRPTFWKRADFTCWAQAGRNADAQNKSYKILHSSQFRCGDHFTAAPMLSQSLRKTDKRGKLSPQQGDRIDMTPSAPDAEDSEDSQNDLEDTNSPSNIDIVLTAKKAESDHRTSRGHSGQRNNLVASASSQVQAALKSPSKSDMSAPTSLPKQMNDNNNVFHKPDQSCEKDSGDIPEDIKRDYEDSYKFSHYYGAGETTVNFMDSGENEKRLYDDDDDDEDDDDCSDIQQLIIKEEYIESAVCDDSSPDPETPPTATAATAMTTPKTEPFFEFPLLTSPHGPEQHKPCPYCPAMFESGVGLSNHVRGHLHRVGLSYNARHMVSAEQVALQDRQPRIRRKIPSSGTRKLKKVDKPESQGHTCPLCWGWFDTKTGLSNHARGHLKRIGKTVITSDKKSPVSILLDLLQDTRERERIVQILNDKEQFPGSRPSFISQKFVSGGGGLFLMPGPAGIPVEIQCAVRNNTVPMGSCAVLPKQEPPEFYQTSKGIEEEDEEEAPHAAAADETETPSSTLVKLLETRKKKAAKELKEREEAFYSTRKHFNMEAEQMISEEESGWTHDDECETGQACGHCNSAVSLSSHLRAFSRRKRFTVLEETSYDFKQKKSRSGHGKKVLSSLNAVEKIYRLTCRFCDLVFQGPLSVQEDWVKHLQRHLMHTEVPHSGTRMVEVMVGGLQQMHHHFPLQENSDLDLHHPDLENNPNLEQHILTPLELQVAS